MFSWWAAENELVANKFNNFPRGSSFELNPYLFTPFLVRQQLGFSPSLVAPAPSTTDISDLGQSLGFSKIQMVPTWLSASICSLCCRSSVTVAPCSPSRSRHLAGFKYLSRYIHFEQSKYQQRLCFILFVNSLSIGWFAWDSASMRRIESAFFKRVRRSSGDRSSTWVQLIVYILYYILYTIL